MSKSTIYFQACQQIVGFQSMSEEFIRKLVINNKARSTHENYLRQMSKLALYYGRTPLELHTSELEEYLYQLIQKDSDSLSSFKHLVYGLRKLYQLFDKEKLQLSLPAINRPNRLPAILSKEEMKRLLKAPVHIRERVMIAFIYDTGIRMDELTNILLSDIDLERGQVHIKHSKNKQDRYLPISTHSIRGIKKHLVLNAPEHYLFESFNRKGMPLSHTRVRNLFNEAVEKAGIKKNICVHSLRHTYATHQLESGQNIMMVKEALGHADVKTTLVYLHIAQVDPVKKFGCLDALYPVKNG